MTCHLQRKSSKDPDKISVGRQRSHLFSPATGPFRPKTGYIRCHCMMTSLFLITLFVLFFLKVHMHEIFIVCF